MIDRARVRQWLAPRIRLLIGLVLATASTWAAGEILTARFRLGYDAQPVSCSRYSMYLVDTADHEPVRHAYYAFRTAGLAPQFADGTLFVKRLEGLPGDEVKVDASGVAVNARLAGALNTDVLRKIHRSADQLQRHERIQAGRYLMLGDLPPSYDGRYWGTIAAAQIFGRAYPLW